MMINQCAADDYSRDQQGRPILRKPADRLGKVVFANEVSIGGVWGGVEVAQVHRNVDIRW